MSIAAGSQPVPVRDVPSRAPQTRPVMVWATAGALMWIFQGYILLKWVTGPFFTPVVSGPDDPPTWMKTTIIGFGVLQGLFFVGVGYRTLVRPWLRERRVTFDGLMFTAFCGWFWFWDPLANAFGLHFTYNAWIPNRGSWVNEIPGWGTPGVPGAQVPEPFLFSAPAYAGLFLLAVAGSVVIRKVMSTGRRGMFSALVICYLATFVLITATEVLWIRLGFYAFPGSYKPWTLFPEHYYAYPLYESLFAGPLTAAAYLRHTLDDKGRSIAERGIERVGTRGSKNAIRLLAVTGWLYLTFLPLYWLPTWAILHHVGNFPMDIQQRSYFTDHLCGPETNRACPGNNVPLFRPGSVTITPDGRVYVPPGVPPIDQPQTFDEAKRRYQAGQR